MRGLMFGLCACTEDSCLCFRGGNFRALVDRSGEAVLRPMILHRGIKAKVHLVLEGSVP